MSGPLKQCCHKESRMCLFPFCLQWKVCVVTPLSLSNLHLSSNMLPHLKSILWHSIIPQITPGWYSASITPVSVLQSSLLDHIVYIKVIV